MIIFGKYAIPNTCPDDCPFKDDLASFSQGIICTRCPVFCCSNDGLISAETYREDWAAVWEEWFKGNKKFYPELKLKI